MADTSIYSMGQIRYKTVDDNNHVYMDEIENFDPHWIKIEALGGLPYQDVILYGLDDSGNLSDFSQYESYYLKLKFLRNLSYDMTFDLKLVNFNKDSGTITNLNQYQEIKRFVVAKDSSGIMDYRNVILYPSITENDSVAVSIVRSKRDLAAIGEVYQLTYIENEGKPDEKTIIEYRIKKENQQQDVVIGEKNMQTLNLSWVQDEADEFFEIGVVFSSKVSNANFNAILLQMNRTPDDDDILHPVGDNPEYRGRYLDIIGNIDDDANTKKFESKCYKINNLVPEGVSAFNNIGVWSHPNSIMTINGEEIRIGQSGYYELNDFEITNFGIVVDGVKDKFSLDYQYKISD